MISHARPPRVFPKTEGCLRARLVREVSLRQMNFPAWDSLPSSEDRRKRCRSNALSICLAASRSVIEISVVRSDEQLRPEETRAFPPKLPRYISMLGFNPFDVHAVRQKKREPRLWRDLFRVRFVNLDFDLA